MTLNEVMKETADAIREKTGKSELIAPVDFATEIKGITAGGGESGGSTIEYFAYETGNVAALISLYAPYVKIEAMEGMIKAVMPYSKTANQLIQQFEGEIKAFGINFNERILLAEGDIIRDTTILESLAESGITREDIDAIPRITKEQFYDLNA